MIDVEDTTEVQEQTPDEVVEEQPTEQPAEQEERQSRAQERIQELLARTREAEERARRSDEIASGLIQRLDAAQTPTAPVEDEWEDPAEKALRRTAEVERKLSEQQDLMARRDALHSIDRAVSARLWEAADDTKERRAERAVLALNMNRQFDAEAEAQRLYDREVKRIDGRKKAWARTKQEQADATKSAMSAPSPPTSPAGQERPPLGTPERRQWDDDIERQILAEHRT